MATSTTTAQAIREKQTAQIEGLTPSELTRARFKRYKRPQDFREWAEENPASCFRRFQISDLGTYEAPIISDTTTEQLATQFEIVTAYPDDTRYGTDGAFGLMDAIRNDQRKIQALIGINGYGEYIAGHRLCSLASFEIEDGEGVKFAVATYDVAFYQVVLTSEHYTSATATATATIAISTSFTGGLYTTASATGSATVSITTSSTLDASASATGSASVNVATSQNLDASASATGSASVAITTSLVAGGPNLLFDGNYTEPATSWTSGRTDFTSAYATNEWILDGPTTGVYAANAGSSTLSNTGGLEDQAAIGIYDGTDYTSTNAWEGLDDNDYLACSDTTTGDIGTSDFCVRIVMRATDPVNNGYIVTKWASGPQGWWIQTNSSGNPIFTVDDNTTQVLTTSVGESVADGAWHYVTAFYDQSSGTIKIKSDVGTEQTATGSLGSITTSTALHVNRRAGGGGVGYHQQVAYVGVCVGANAQAMYDEAFWQHATDPNIGTGYELTTQDRASAIKVQVAAGNWANFSDDQLPIGYSPARNAGAGGYAVATNSAVTNLVPYSRLSTGATNSNITATDYAADGTDGFRAATSLAATANNGYQAKTCTTVASTDYCGSVMIKESTVGVTGRVILYDESNAAELGSTAFTATSTWTPVAVAASTIAGGVSTSLRVEVDTSGETVLVDDWQLELGDERGHTIPTSGASASLAFGEYVVTGTAGEHAKAQAGEVEIVHVIKKQSNGSEIWWQADDAGAQANSRLLRQGSDLDFDFLGYQNTGASLAINTASTPRSVDTEYTTICRWDCDAGLAVTAGATGELLVNGTSVANTTNSIDYAPGLDSIRIGNDGSDATSSNGWIARLRIWDGEGGA